MATKQSSRKPSAVTPGRPTRPDLLVLLDPQLALCREIARGVWAYAAESPQWWVRVGTVPSPDTLRRVMPGRLAGVIGFFGAADLEDAAIETYPRAPVVNVSARPRVSRLPRVLADNVQVGRLAGEHLLTQGFRHFAFAPVSGHLYSIHREYGFREVVEAAGHQVISGTSSIRELPGWLASLPRPVGVMVATDARAVQVVQACREGGLAVPEDVAIVGVDNDEYLCESSPIGISSVDPAGRRIGYRAAKLIAEISAGGPRPGEPILTPPHRVVVRHSSDTTAIEDPDVAFAARFIRDHACQKLRIDEILEHLDISRRTLEKRFRKHFGRSLHEEIRRVQMETACMLLSETDLRVPEVAARAGFSDRKLLGMVEGPLHNYFDNAGEGNVFVYSSGGRGRSIEAVRLGLEGDKLTQKKLWGGVRTRNWEGGTSHAIHNGKVFVNPSGRGMGMTWIDAETGKVLKSGGSSERAGFYGLGLEKYVARQSKRDQTRFMAFDVVDNKSLKTVGKGLLCEPEATGEIAERHIAFLGWPEIWTGYNKISCWGNRIFIRSNDYLWCIGDPKADYTPPEKFWK